MAINRFFNITGSTGVTTELMAPLSNSSIKSMLLANIHASANATVNIITAITIPTGSSLVLEEVDIPSIPSKFGVYITVAASDTVDVIVNV